MADMRNAILRGIGESGARSFHELADMLDEVIGEMIDAGQMRAVGEEEAEYELTERGFALLEAINLRRDR